jgi:hypothetical protein
MSDGGYLIGYGKPPRQSQFKKGQSGNPHGRPRKKPAPTDLNSLLRDELAEHVEITVGERRMKITKSEAMIKLLVNRASKGDSKAMSFIMNQMAKTSQGTTFQIDEKAAQRNLERFQRLLDTKQQESLAIREQEVLLRRRLRECGVPEAAIDDVMGTRGLTENEQEERRHRGRARMLALAVPADLFDALDAPLVQSIRLLPRLGAPRRNAVEAAYGGASNTAASLPAENSARLSDGSGPLHRLARAGRQIMGELLWCRHS